MIELAVEVAGFEDDFLVEDVLINADVVSAGALCGDGMNVVGSDGGAVVGLFEEGFEAGELGDKGGLCNTSGCVGAEAPLRCWTSLFHDLSPWGRAPTKIRSRCSGVWPLFIRTKSSPEF